MSIQLKGKNEKKINIEIEEHTPYDIFVDIANKAIMDEFIKDFTIRTNATEFNRDIIPLFSISPGKMIYTLHVPKNTVVKFDQKFKNITGLVNIETQENNYDFILPLSGQYINI